MITRKDVVEHTLLTLLVEEAGTTEDYARKLLAEFTLDKVIPSVNEEIDTLYDYNINISKLEMGRRIIKNINDKLEIFKGKREL